MKILVDKFGDKWYQTEDGGYWPGENFKEVTETFELNSDLRGIPRSDIDNSWGPLTEREVKE